MFRKLDERDNPLEKTIEMSPSPSPVPSVNISLGGVDNVDQGSSVDRQAPAPLPKEEPIDRVTDERCDISSNRCPDNKNMIACLSHAGTGSQGSFLLVQNDGEISLKVNFTILPVNFTLKEIELLKHQAKKINISANVGGSPTIVLNAGNGNCVIHMGSPAPEDNFYKQFSSYATFVTPINALNVKTAEGWDQGWDEEKAVNSPGGNHVGNGHANGFTSRSSKSDGWGNDWDD